MQRDFWYRLIEKYFEQLIDSFRVFTSTCRFSKANDFKHYLPRHPPAHAKAHMRCTAAIDE